MEMLCYLMVSIHAPVWERHGAGLTVDGAVGFQSTLPCGSDGRTTVPAGCQGVSIHAPVWERPAPHRHIRLPGWFQSTLPCGSDSRPCCFLPGIPRFNPRSRVGATDDRELLGAVDQVSIHAPVWERPMLSGPWGLITWFQSTLPCGSDRCEGLRPVRVAGFNPRSRVGATGSDDRGAPHSGVSIHAPVWERLYQMDMM